VSDSPRTHPFTGPCLNGPWQGKTYASHDSSFVIAFCPPAGPADDWDGGTVEKIRHGTYRWSYGRSAWFWEAPR
jgi:hypothetical protein